MEKKDSSHINSCICEVARQFAHPTDGLVTKTVPECLPDGHRPITFNQWGEFLKGCTCAWVNVGLEEDIAEVFRMINWGEIIPNTNPDLSLFKASFFSRVILEKLRPKNVNGEQEELTHRVVLNHSSFIRLAKVICADLSYPDNRKFMDGLTAWNKTIAPRVFWVNFLVPERIGKIIESKKIGEVITRQGQSTFFDFLPTEHEDEGIICYNKKDGTFYRLIINETTVSKIFIHAARYKGIDQNTAQNKNFFEFLGGIDKDISSIFSKLSI